MLKKLYTALLPGGHYEKVYSTSAAFFIGLEVLDDGPKFSGMVGFQDRL